MNSEWIWPALLVLYVVTSINEFGIKAVLEVIWIYAVWIAGIVAVWGLVYFIRKYFLGF